MSTYTDVYECLGQIIEPSVNTNINVNMTEEPKNSFADTIFVETLEIMPQIIDKVIRLDIDLTENARADAEIKAEIIDSSPRQLLEDILIAYCKDKYSNGINQHTPEWLEAKTYTVGGSTIPILMGVNPYSSKSKLLHEKIGIEKFKSDIKPQWGNLFEDVIKRYVESVYNCIVHGENLYVVGSDNCTSYSPDGLAVIDITDYELVETVVKDEYGSHVNQGTIESTRPQIVLLEFKCPYSRIPTGRIPDYYVPQVLMGLDLLKLPTCGLFIEGVFRRCALDQLDLSPKCDRTLVKALPTYMTTALCYGIIGFNMDIEKVSTNALIIPLLDNYIAYFKNYGSNELGTCSVELFTELMNAYDNKLIDIWYGENKTSGKCDEDIKAFEQHCADSGHVNIGILPYKLMRTYTNKVKKIDGYLDRWVPEIQKIIGIVKQCEGKNEAEQRTIINEYCM